MKAQMLYDLQSRFEICSGDELADFFRQLTGNPSPSGEVEVSYTQAVRLLTGRREAG